MLKVHAVKIEVIYYTIGDKPKIKAPPKIAEKAVQGEQVRLTCEAEGQGPFKYVWMHNNQTLVKEAGSCKKIAELMIERMTDAHQGKYKCCFTNAFGFNVSEPVTLLLGMLHLFTPISSLTQMLFIVSLII